MGVPVSVRLPVGLQEALARYCREQEISRTEAIERGLRLLLGQPRPRRPLTPQGAVESLARLRSSIRIRFDPEQASAEGRD